MEDLEPRDADEGDESNACGGCSRRADEESGWSMANAGDGAIAYRRLAGTYRPHSIPAAWHRPATPNHA
jgi:hypothetical protein